MNGLIVAAKDAFTDKPTPISSLRELNCKAHLDIINRKNAIEMLLPLP